MKMKIEYKNINTLFLDSNNDRFAELYSGSDKENDLIEYLLYTEAAEEVAQNISSKGYYPDEVLWVIKRASNEFLVKDGNRRCAAVKALMNPRKYGLNLPKTVIKKLPVIVYADENELERRIQEQHTHSLFREWDRIAKALKVYEMRNSGSSEAILSEIDSNPAQLIKLANFYYTAVKIAGEDLKKLLRRGRGNTGGKTIIFERLFSYSKQCGYKFKNKPSYQIEILNKAQFTEYINALVAYLKDYPETKHQDIDNEKSNFLNRLKNYGFTQRSFAIKTTDKQKENENRDIYIEKRGTTKSRPVFTRKQVAPKLKRLIDECYNLDNSNFANAKVALARITFESVLKYVVEQTKYKNKELYSYDYFRSAFFDNKGNRRKYTDFTTLKNKFVELIVKSGIKNSFKQFDLERLHQVIHNYKVGASPNDARTAAENLMPLIEFMLQDVNELILSLDTKKLV